MHAPLKALFYAFLGWLIPFMTAQAIDPLREQGHPLFETVMPLNIALCGVFFGLSYLGAATEAYAREGFIFGLLCFFVSFSLDLAAALIAPTHASIFLFLTDIGMTVLLYPIVIVGMGLLLQRKMRERDHMEAVAG